jgi:hypothetical protein
MAYTLSIPGCPSMDLPCDSLLQAAKHKVAWMHTIKQEAVILDPDGCIIPGARVNQMIEAELGRMQRDVYEMTHYLDTHQH